MNNETGHFRLRLTPSGVIATIALFFAIGGAGAVAATHLGKGSVGTAQLRAGAVTGAKVKDGSLTGADVNASTLGQVPLAAHADSAASADHAGDARRADSATHADSASQAESATTATHALTADSATSAGTAKTAEIAAALTEPEPVHILNRSGEPKTAATFTVNINPGFYRDHEGIVHLQGEVTPNVEAAEFLFEIPVGDRPAQPELFPGIGSKAPAKLEVLPGGSLYVHRAEKGETVSLDGITWRAAS